jgi:hypothetical protein
MLLTIGALRTPAAAKVAASARSFGRQFHALKSAQSISPIERLFLSFATMS